MTSTRYDGSIIYRTAKESGIKLYDYKARYYSPFLYPILEKEVR